MSFPEKALQTRAACAALHIAWRMGHVFNRRGLGQSWAPRGIPKVLCLCDLSLLENPNIQKCLLQKPGRTRGLRLPHRANRIPAPSLEACSLPTFAGITKTDQREAHGVLLGISRPHYSLSLLSPQLAAQTALGEWEWGGEGAPLAPGISAPDVIILFT